MADWYAAMEVPLSPLAPRVRVLIWRGADADEDDEEEDEERRGCVNGRAPVAEGVAAPADDGSVAASSFEAKDGPSASDRAFTAAAVVATVLL